MPTERQVEVAAREMFYQSLGGQLGFWHWPGDDPEPTRRDWGEEQIMGETISADHPSAPDGGKKPNELRAIARRILEAVEHVDETLERAIREACCVDLRRGRLAPEDVYASLINTEWVGPGGVVTGLSFRAAAALIADMLWSGDYMDWYCCALYPEMNEKVEERMAVLGWTHRPVDVTSDSS